MELQRPSENFQIGLKRRITQNAGQAVIAKYSNDEWSNEGSLIQGRYSHAAISHNDVTLIIGGSTDDGKP